MGNIEGAGCQSATTEADLEIHERLQMVHLMASLHRRVLRMIDGLLADVEAGRRVSPSKLRDGRMAISEAVRRGNEGRSDRRQRRGQQLDARKLDRSDIRLQVAARAGALCEACLLEFTPSNPGEWDHVLGGIGRRVQQQSVMSTWLIHATCHRERTANRPSSRHWWEIFRAHALRHGYDAMAREAEKHL